MAYNKKILSDIINKATKAKGISKPKDIDYNSKMGYRDDSPFRNKSSIDINTPNGTIDMSNTGKPLLANGRYLPPYSGTHQFNTNVVTEQPLQAKKGGLVQMPKPTKKGLASKKYSRSLSATNRLFTENSLFKKQKSKKRKVFDPNAKYYQDGGNKDAMTGMMKARLAYANEFGNPAAKRMINLPDNPYQFDNGDTGTHYMASMDNYAIPQIQDENGQLMLGDYGPESREAIRFDSDEDANYFAEHYKDVSPGFIEADLNDVKIQEYVKGGYIVEELNSYAPGGESGCPKDHVWDQYSKKCIKVYTLANDKKFIDGVGNWAMQSDNPDKISSKYNEQIKNYLYSGNYGYDPKSGSLYKLPKKQTTVADTETKKILAKQEDKVAYKQSIIDAGFNPETFGKSKGTNVITGEQIYGDKSQEDVDEINKEAVNDFVTEGHKKAILESPFNTVANFTPAGMAAGVMQGAANLLPDVYNFAKDPSWSGAGQIGMDFLQTAPLIKPAANTIKSAFKNAYNLNPRALKENPEMYVYRARPVGQNPDMNMAATLRAKEAAGEPLNWMQKNIIKMSEGKVPDMGGVAAREKYYGRWFDKDPKNLDYYINPDTRNFADNDAIEILRSKLPKAEADKLKVSQFEDAKSLSGFPEREFILPKDLVNSAERFPESSWQQLIQEDKAFNTPHWLKGYKKVSTELPGSPNASISGRLKQFFDRPPGPLMLGMPTGLGLGAASQMQGEDLNEEYKDGGIISEVSDKEIKDLIAQGFIVEEINNSFKYAPGGEFSPKDLDPATLEKYLSDLRVLENSIKKGYKNNKWYPHASIEGGANTIAYGHKLMPDESFSSGLTEQQARDLQKKDVLAHQVKAEKFVDKKYGEGSYDKLPQNSQMLLTDYAYNLGSLNKFPSFVEGVVKKDKNKMLQQYERRGLNERNKWTKDIITTTDFSKDSDEGFDWFNSSSWFNPSSWFNKKNGGAIEINIKNKKDFQKYINQGYIIEEL